MRRESWKHWGEGCAKGASCLSNREKGTRPFLPAQQPKNLEGENFFFESIARRTSATTTTFFEDDVKMQPCLISVPRRPIVVCVVGNSHDGHMTGHAQCYCTSTSSRNLTRSVRCSARCSTT